MKTFPFSYGSHSLREKRLLHGSMGPENHQHHERQEGDIYLNRLDGSEPELLKVLDQKQRDATKKTVGVISDELECIRSSAQRDIDALSGDPKKSKQYVIDYIAARNEQLHKDGHHIGMIGTRVTIAPYHPKQFAPEVIARRDKIRELKAKIDEVDKNIKLLMGDFAKDGAEYSKHKHASMRRTNSRPEITRFLMQFPQASMQAHADPLHQLYAIKFQLVQELSGIESGRIKVPVPAQGQQQTPEDPSLINDPRFVPEGRDGTRFDLTGAPGGIGPDGLPLQNGLPDAALQGKILRYAERWRECRTQEERDTVEGFLMMDGVDTDASNLAKDDIVMVAPEERGIQFLIGFIVVLKSFIDRMNRQKTVIEDAEVSETAPSTLALDERTQETEENNVKLKDLATKKEKTKGEIKEIKKKLEAVPPPEGEAKEKLENDLKQKKKELKKIEEEIQKLEDRNAALADAQQKSREQDIDAKNEKLEEDPVLREFARLKAAAKVKHNNFIKNMSKNLERNLKDAAQRDFERTGKLPDYDWRKEHTKIIEETMKVFDAMLDNMHIEKNDAGQYRFTIDMIETSRSLGDAYILSNQALQKMVQDMNKYEKIASIDGGKIVTPFMSGDELMKSKLMKIDPPEEKHS